MALCKLLRPSRCSWNRGIVPYFCSRSLHLSTGSAAEDKSYRFVVCGAGAGGLAVGSSLGRRFGPGQLAVIEPAEVSAVRTHITAGDRRGRLGCEETARSGLHLIKERA